MQNHTLPKNMFKALEVITSALSGQDASWVVITSCALALQGMSIQPTDIDILTDGAGALTIHQYLCDFETKSLHHASSEIFRSHFACFCINDVVVELMGDFEVKASDGTWHNTNYLLTKPVWITYQGLAVPVISFNDAIKLYQLMGREKDMVKVVKIEQHIATYGD